MIHTIPKPYFVQKGAVLVVSLLILLVMTIISVTAMQSTVMEEKMAGNSKELNMAFHAAEAAAREGETWLSAQIQPPIVSSTGCGANCLVWDSYRGATALFSTSGTNSYTVDALWNNARTSALSLSGMVNSPPLFVIELTDILRDSQNLGHQQDLALNSFRSIYSVTSRSTGGAGLARSFIQTSFAKRF